MTIFPGGKVLNNRKIKAVSTYTVLCTSSHGNSPSIPSVALVTTEGPDLGSRTGAILREVDIHGSHIGAIHVVPEPQTLRCGAGGGEYSTL